MIDIDAFRSIDQVDVKGKRVFMRVDYNVPGEGGMITDERRIRLSLDSARSVIKRGGRLILACHRAAQKAMGPICDTALPRAPSAFKECCQKPKSHWPTIASAKPSRRRCGKCKTAKC